MPHRLGLAIVVATGLAVLGLLGAHLSREFVEVLRTLPGGMEGVPDFTRTTLGVCTWLGRWWLPCALLAAALLLGVPWWAARSEEGARRVARVDALLARYGPAVLALYVAIAASAFFALAYAFFLPLLQIIEQLTA